MTNSKFSVSIHILSLLAYFKDVPMTSEIIASSVNTNPVVIRRLITLLKKSGLLAAKSGNSGGIQLAKAPEKILLSDVYATVETTRFLATHSNPENKKCPVSRNIKDVFGEVVDHAEQALLSNLKKTTIADLAKEISIKEKK